MAKLSERTGVGISQEIVEPLINTSTSTTTDTTSFSRSDEGVSIVAINSANAVITKRVQSSYATSNNESYRLLVSPGNNVWIDAQARFPFITSATAKYGMRITAVSSTQVDVEFGGDGAAAGDPWSNYTSWKWKLLKHRDGRTLNTTTNGIVPIGSVIAIANVAVWSLPAAGQIKDGFALCNGQAVPAGAHPLLTGTLPDLSDERFLQGSTTSGSIGGSTSKTTTGITASFDKNVMNTNQNSHFHLLPFSFYGSADGSFSQLSTLLNQNANGVPYYGQVSIGASGSALYNRDIMLNPSNISAAKSSSETISWTSSTVNTTVTQGTISDIRPKYFNVVYVMRVL